MITRILAKDFRGFDIDQEIGEKTLFVGPNNSGKTAHCLAMVLSVLGYIPGKGKGNAEILDTFGPKDSFHVGIQIGKKVFGRQFLRKGKSVSEAFRIDSKSSTAKEYLSTLGQVGNPHIFDLARFMDLSDAKKIHELFNLFPPGEDLDKNQAQIDTATKARDKLAADITKSEGAAERLVTARAEMDLPSGTHAEVTTEIERIAAELGLARKNLRAAEIKDAQAKGKADAEADAKVKADADAKAKADADAMAKTRTKAKVKPDAEVPREVSRETAKLGSLGTAPATQLPLEPPGTAPTQEPASEKVEPGVDHLKDAIAAIEAAALEMECGDICSIAMIAKDRIRKLFKEMRQ